MKCQTVLAGTECTFWGKQGCIFPGGSCQVIAENCEGCDRIVTGSIGQVCSAYPAPVKKWVGGICNFASHVKVDLSVADLKVNPLKASKKAAGAKKKK
ncbi:MAG TPA: PxxKW family cysteine-rich protein [Dongiaceae bacterium]|nr:PxxKW family cysteine-rich protein [Dongiaceae bacterium]